MDIRLDEIGKRYRYEWVFKKVNYRFENGRTYALLGPNGSGKSTFLKILIGHLSPTKGKITFSHQDKVIKPDLVYQHLSLAAPYMELLEEFTLEEAIPFHAKFKSFKEGLTTEDLIQLLYLESSADKPIRFFSSGMKQRLKLGLALCSDTPSVFLDEPTTNLDREGIAWYKSLIDRFGKNRLLVVASNVEEDYGFCEERVEVGEWK
ncbi:MAG: ATP-binding cassette domain-containing protein [Saprospiraceae bacterium]